ncbi:hypothetical protein EUX98_g8902 [Antrodiella citrinella]|uniref:Uncharacterized protein n=1 Tax=Antrodiella citrinella TaxID=2447956 RepID=A0A4S4M176_9APHY|nr:hypothetical protein EUX98_g8902 [Antrodiella citrinella]
MSTGTKRKSTGIAGSSKKARISDVNPHAPAIALVNSILANAENFEISDDDAVIRNELLHLAQYARALEGQVATSGGVGQTGSSKSPEEIADAVEKLRRAAVAGIKKHMSWKPSCNSGTAKWTYDGVCTDPVIFGALMGLDGPPTWKQKKFSVDDFESLFGEVTGSVRYVFSDTGFFIKED